MLPMEFSLKANFFVAQIGMGLFAFNLLKILCPSFRHKFGLMIRSRLPSNWCAVVSLVYGILLVTINSSAE